MMQLVENIGAGEGNRTLVISLEGCCSTIELHPHLEPAVKRQHLRMLAESLLSNTTYQGLTTDL